MHRETELIQDGEPPDMLPGYPLFVASDERNNAVVSRFQDVTEPLTQSQSTTALSDNDSGDGLFQTEHPVLPLRNQKRVRKKRRPAVNQGDPSESSTDDEEFSRPENGISEIQAETRSTCNTNSQRHNHSWRGRPFPFKNICKRELQQGRRTLYCEYGAIAGFFSFVKKMKHNLKSEKDPSSASRLRKEQFMDDDDEEELVPISEPDQSEDSENTDSEDVMIVEPSHFILKYNKRFRNHNLWLERNSRMRKEDENIHIGEVDLDPTGNPGEQTGTRRMRTSVVRKAGGMISRECKPKTVVTQPRRRRINDDKGKLFTGLTNSCDLGTAHADAQSDIGGLVEGTAAGDVPHRRSEELCEPTEPSVTRKMQKRTKSSQMQSSRIFGKKSKRRKVIQAKDLVVEKAVPPDISLWLKQSIEEDEQMEDFQDFVTEDGVAGVAEISDSRVFDMAENAVADVWDEECHVEGNTAEDFPTQNKQSRMSPAEMMPAVRTKDLLEGEREKDSQDQSMSEDEMSLFLFSQDEREFQQTRSAIGLHDVTVESNAIAEVQNRMTQDENGGAMEVVAEDPPVYLSDCQPEQSPVSRNFGEQKKEDLTQSFSKEKHRKKKRKKHSNIKGAGAPHVTTLEGEVVENDVDSVCLQQAGVPRFVTTGFISQKQDWTRNKEAISSSHFWQVSHAGCCSSDYTHDHGLEVAAHDTGITKKKKEKQVDRTEEVDRILASSEKMPVLESTKFRDSNKRKAGETGKMCKEKALSPGKELMSLKTDHKRKHMSAGKQETSHSVGQHGYASDPDGQNGYSEQNDPVTCQSKDCSRTCADHKDGEHPPMKKKHKRQKDSDVGGDGNSTREDISPVLKPERNRIGLQVSSGLRSEKCSNGSKNGAGKGKFLSIVPSPRLKLTMNKLMGMDINSDCYNGGSNSLKICQGPNSIKECTKAEHGGSRDCLSHAGGSDVKQGVIQRPPRLLTLTRFRNRMTSCIYAGFFRNGVHSKKKGVKKKDV